MSNVQDFKTEFPEWDDIPDELVEETITFTLWSSRQALVAVGRDLGLAGIRLLERLSSWGGRR